MGGAVGSGQLFGSELERRRRAVELVVDAGQRPCDVAEELGRSREWVHKWLRRFREEGAAGLMDRPRAPKRPPNGIGEATVAEVLRIRKELEDDVVASVGAMSILATMEREGWEPIPSVASIERILHQAGKTRPYRRHQRSGARLPLPEEIKPGAWQQIDWVQDRWLQGGIRFNSIQAVDVASWAMESDQYLTRHIGNAGEFTLDKAWPMLSIPLTMGVDNAFVHTTHPNNPFTLFARLCLFFGVEVLVAPPGGLGWTNHVESINNTWQQRTIRASHFNSLEELKTGSAKACHWLNHYRPVHDPAVYGSRYPIEVIARHADQLRWPPQMSLQDHKDRKGNVHIPLAAGRITYIRHANEQRTIEIAKSAWTLPPAVPIGGLVIATIATDEHTLSLRHQGELVAAFAYPITHPIVEPYYPPANHGLLDHPETTIAGS
jgi:putative transposase